MGLRMIVSEGLEVLRNKSEELEVFRMRIVEKLGIIRMNVSDEINIIKINKLEEIEVLRMNINA